jgi:hypothetical protein
MEDLIKKIEQYQAENKLLYDEAMKKPVNEIIYDFSSLIGQMNGQLIGIKLDIELKIIKDKYK